MWAGEREARFGCLVGSERGLNDFLLAALYLGDGERDQPSFRRFNIEMLDSTKAAWGKLSN